jgi:hypothetical protein
LEPVSVCLEVKGQAIEVQEFLQRMGREQSWNMGESRASEDSWSYVRYFDAGELAKYADTSTLADAVKFSNGKAAVTVRTTDIEQGYVRVQITAHFQGDGRSTDKVLGQPATQWPLTSKGALETELSTALQIKYRPLE